MHLPSFCTKFKSLYYKRRKWDEMVLPKATWKNKYGILLLLHEIHVFSWHTDVRDNGIFTKGIEGENQTQTFQHKPMRRRRLKAMVWNLGCWLRGACVCKTFPGPSPQPSGTEPRSFMALDASGSGWAWRPFPHCHLSTLESTRPRALGRGYWKQVSSYSKAEQGS